MSSLHAAAAAAAARVLPAVVIAFSGCSSSSGAGSPPADAGVDAGLPVNGCGESEFAANDHTADADPRTIQGPGGATPLQYVPSCMRIKAGQTVTFLGDIGHHPVDTAEVSGGMPYPINTSTMPTTPPTFTVTIPQPGVVRFNCDVHPATMKGAIEIVP
jgi:plastocyanin